MPDSTCISSDSCSILYGQERSCCFCNVVKRGFVCEGGGGINRQRRGKGGAADDGGSVHAALPADTLSSDISAFMNQVGRSRLQRFPADASRSDEKLCPQCKHRAAALSSFPLPAFSIVCAMSSFTGRRFKGHGRIVAVWVSKNSGFLQSGNFSRISGVKLQRYLNYRDFNCITSWDYTVLSGLS